MTINSRLSICRFVTGIPTYVVVNATDLNYPGRISRLELINLSGDLLTEIPITYEPTRPSLYNTTSFTPPRDFFYLKVRPKDFTVEDKWTNVHLSCQHDNLVAGCLM